MSLRACKFLFACDRKPQLSSLEFSNKCTVLFAFDIENFEELYIAMRALRYVYSRTTANNRIHNKSFKALPDAPRTISYSRY